MVVIQWYITRLNAGFALQWKCGKYKSPESHSECAYSIIFKQATVWNLVNRGFQGNKVMEPEDISCEKQMLKMLSVDNSPVFKHWYKSSHELASNKPQINSIWKSSCNRKHGRKAHWGSFNLKSVQYLGGKEKKKD